MAEPAGLVVEKPRRAGGVGRQHRQRPALRREDFTEARRVDETAVGGGIECLDGVSLAGVDRARRREGAVDIRVADDAMLPGRHAGDEAGQGDACLAGIDRALPAERHALLLQAMEIGRGGRSDEVRTQPVKKDDKNA